MVAYVARIQQLSQLASNSHEMLSHKVAQLSPLLAIFFTFSDSSTISGAIALCTFTSLLTVFHSFMVTKLLFAD